jgi:hypothetical protein
MFDIQICWLVSKSLVKTIVDSTRNLLQSSLLTYGSLVVIVATCTPFPPLLLADDQATNTPSQRLSSADTRYGLFNWLDHRSAYGEGVYPEPFLVDDSDLERGEFRLDWFHTQASTRERDDLAKAEVETGFGLLTLEIEVPYEVDNDTAANKTTDGFDNIDLGARYPIYQFVSDDKFVDSTFGAGIEVGIPTRSSFSKDAEVVPKIFDDLRLGTRFTLQSIVGLSMLYGTDENNGLKTFEYGLVFGYTIPREDLPVPDVMQLIPFFELVGETELNHADPGHNSLTGNAGCRMNLKTIGSVQPRPGVGFIFPIDSGARDDLHWGVITSLVFEY